MKLTTKLLALLLVLVMLLPMVVACSEPAVENNPAQDKTPEADVLAPLPESQEKVDAKALLLELLKDAEVDANAAKVKIKFKGDLNISFLDPELSYSTDDLIDYVDEDGYLTLPVSDILEMMGGESAIIEMLGNGLKEYLLKFISNGDYANLEDMLGGLYDSFNIEGIQENSELYSTYMAAIAVPQMLGLALKANEKMVHEAYGDPYDTDAEFKLEMCNQSIDMSVMQLTDLIIKDINAETTLEDIIEIIAYSGILDIAATGSICGMMGEDEEPWYPMYELMATLYSILDSVENAKAAYNGDGNYNLEVYYPAISDNLVTIFELFYESDDMFNNNIIALKVLDEYLASEDGPIAQLDVSELLMTVASAALAARYTDYLVYASGLSYQSPDVAFFNLADESWYVLDEESITESIIPVDDGTEINVLDYYDHGFYYVVFEDGYLSSPVSYDVAYEIAYDPANIYAVYSVEIGDDKHVDYAETYEEGYGMIFDLLVSGIRTEVAEEDKLLVGSAIISYLATYPVINNDISKLMDSAFTDKFILSVLADTVLDSADEVVADVLELFGVVDEDTTDDVDPVAEIVNDFILTVDPEGMEILTPEDALVAYVITVLINEEVAGALGEYYFGASAVPFANITAIYLYDLFLNPDRSEGFYPADEDLTDGLPLITVIAMLSEYVNINDSEYYDSLDVIRLISEYYEVQGDIAKIINFEDIYAFLFAIENGMLEDVYAYKYPFDMFEHIVIGSMLHMAINEKYAEYEGDPSQINYAHETVQAFMDKIYLVDCDYDALALANRVMMLVIFPDVYAEGVPALSDAIEAAMESKLNDPADRFDLTIPEAYLSYVLPTLFEYADEEETVRYLDQLLALLAPNFEAEKIANITDALAVVYYGLPDLTQFDAATWGYFLDQVADILTDNGIDATVLETIADKVGAVDELTVDVLLDIAFTEAFGEDYTVLTDVILSYLAGVEAEELIPMIDNALTVLEDDMVAVGYLRALKAALNEEELKGEGIINAFALLYLANKYEADVSMLLVPALYMTEEEFVSFLDLGEDMADVLAVRAWADKYLGIYTANGDVNVIELVVDYLVAVGYYDESEIPAANDPDYYQKLATIYAAEMYFQNDEYANAVVDTIFNPENIHLYGDTFFEMAEETVVEAPEDRIMQIVLYMISTKAYLEVADPTTVNWDEVLAYVPVVYSELTGKELEIGNYAALSEMLRPAFTEAVNTAFEATVVPYETSTEIVYVFTVTGELEHVAVEGDCEMIIEIRVPKTVA